MTPETRNEIERAIKVRRAQLGTQADPYLGEWMIVAEAERLLEEADRAEKALPYKFARVNALGHHSYVGPVTALPRGGYRVEHHEVTGPVGAKVPSRRFVDVYAVHSVTGLSETEWEDERAQLEESAAVQNKHYWQSRTLPDGYTVVPADISGHFRFKRPDGMESRGNYWGEPDARRAAWRHSEGKRDEESDFPEDFGEGDDEPDEVERWLVDSTAEMPEVLRG